MTIVNRSMRVMHIISGDLWAGAEVQACTLLCQLQQEVTLRVIVLNSGELSKRLTLAGISVCILPEASMSSFGIFLRLIVEVFKFRPEIVHTHRKKENILGGIAWLISRVLGRAKASVRTVHGAAEYIPRGLGRVQAALDVAVGRWLQNAVIAVSEDLTNKLIPVFGLSKLVFIRNGVSQPNPQAAQTSQDFNIPGVAVGIVGRLEPVKRVDIFLRMAAILLKEAPNIPWSFHVFGDGRQALELKQLAKQLGIEQAVCFYGQVSAIEGYLSSLTALVMCSDHEGTPMTALEAMSLRVPLIAHNVGGLSELLRGEPRALVDDHSPQGYADRVLNFVHLPFDSLQLPEEYTSAYNCHQVLNLYCRLAGRCC